MKNNITELVFILDRSGSMHGLEGDTIGGFNSMIEKQKTAYGEAYVSTVLFSNDSEVVHDRVSLDKIKPMTRNDYVPSGCTALMDAIGDADGHRNGTGRIAVFVKHGEDDGLCPQFFQCRYRNNRDIFSGQQRQGSAGAHAVQHIGSF